MANSADDFMMMLSVILSSLASVPKHMKRILSLGESAKSSLASPLIAGGAEPGNAADGTQTEMTPSAANLEVQRIFRTAVEARLAHASHAKLLQLGNTVLSISILI
eukprot:6236045-Prymnesium_polylepis.1